MIYPPPKEILQPTFDYAHFDIRAIEAAEAEYVSKIKVWAKEHGKGEYAGEEIRFPVADGYARYIVVSVKPVKLIHLPLGDAYAFQYAHRLTSSDVLAEAKRQRSIAAIFSQKGASL